MGLVRFFRKSVLIAMTGLALGACNNDLELLSPDYQVYPLVYSMLELHRDTFFVRVTRTFVGEGSAYEYARIEDSLYFPEARVWLEKWNGDMRVARAELVKTNLRPRIPGIFLESPNWQYIVVRSPQTEILFTGSQGDQEYHLAVEIPGRPLIYASTMAYTQADLIEPRRPLKINLYQNPIQFTWKNPAPYSEMYFRILYHDVYQDTAIARSLNWREYHSVVQEEGATESVFGQDVMKRIAGSIPNDPRVIYRPITAFQVVLVGIPAALHDYRMMAEVAPTDQIGFPVTNVVNGLGLFTSQTQAFFELDLDLKSKDSIMNGQYTKHLKLKLY